MKRQAAAQIAAIREIMSHYRWSKANKYDRIDDVLNGVVPGAIVSGEIKAPKKGKKHEPST